MKSQHTKANAYMPMMIDLDTVVIVVVEETKAIMNLQREIWTTRKVGTPAEGRSFCFWVEIKSMQVPTSSDGGSSHNLIVESIAVNLKLPILFCHLSASTETLGGLRKVLRNIREVPP